MGTQYYKLRRACDVRQQAREILYGAVAVVFWAAVLLGTFLFLAIFGD